MAIWDNNGTTTYEIGKMWDNNGTTTYQIGKVYDYDGTTSSLIYTAEEYLFKYGTGEIVAFTYGGQENSSRSTSTNGIVITFKSDDDYVSYIRPTNAINLTNYSKLVAKVNCTKACPKSDYQLSMIVTSSAFGYTGKVTQFGTRVAMTANSTDTIYTIDISSLSGSYYVGFFGASNATIKDFYFE